MSRKITIIVGMSLSLCLAFGIMSGCQQEIPRIPKKPVTITFYQRGYSVGGSDVTTVTTDQAIALFQKKYPTITVNIVGVPWTAEGDTVIDNVLVSRADIHILRIRSDFLVPYAKQGWLANIEPFLTEEDHADFYASGFQAAMVDGKIYAWPLWVTAFVMYANTQIFQDRGVTVPTLENPWTWDEFVAAAKQLTYTTTDGKQVYGFTASSKPGLMYVDGGRMLSPDGKRFVQNSPEGVSALQKIADLALVHQVTPPDFATADQKTARKHFKDGSVAMLMVPPAFIRELESAEFPFATFPIPTGNVGKVTTTGAFGLYAVVQVDDQDILNAAQALAKYLTGSEVASAIPNWQQAPGLRRSNTSYATTPAREVVAKLVGFGVYETPVPVSVALRNRYWKMIEDVVLGNKTAQIALDEIAPDYQQELEQWQ
jgi:multiple sugar transport system substrate-binding protein